MHYTATYSPEDNKLRLYASGRLPADLYAEARRQGFIWAPKQELFVAPAWSPSREDFLLTLCDEIGDEDTSLVDRAEQRAERFEDYSDKRAEDADRAKKAVDTLSGGIPMGQPILIGHHSEKRARKDAERIENGMRKAVKMWETSEYWTSRAAGALRHAKYKELPKVRANRIKRIEADKRREERTLAKAIKRYNAWKSISTMAGAGELLPEDHNEMNAAQRLAYMIANYHSSWTAQHPTSLEANKKAMEIWHHGFSAYDFLTKKDFIGCPFETLTPKQVAELYLQTTKNPSIPGSYSHRWLAHFDNRLAYEKAMLDEQGASDLLKPKPRPEQLPICNYRAPEGFIMIENNYHRGEMLKYTQLEMTRAEYAKIYKDYKGTRDVEGSHRVRTTIKGHTLSCVFLTDSKVHEKPEPIAKKKIAAPAPRPVLSTYQEPQRTAFDDMRDTLKAGVKIVTAPQLFPTPKEIAEKMADLLDVQPGQSVLEPSAGTGMLIGALGGKMFSEPSSTPHKERKQITLVEINRALADRLESEFPLSDVICADFLSIEPAREGNASLIVKQLPQAFYDRIIMNPPFSNGEDIKHIRHALNFLKTDGVLVALCANGPRQRDAFKDQAETWEDLPAGSFKEQGTNVNVALMVLRKEG